MFGCKPLEVIRHAVEQQVASIADVELAVVVVSVKVVMFVVVMSVRAVMFVEVVMAVGVLDWRGGKRLGVGRN